MKLYIDDIRAAPEGWHLARTVTEAIRILAALEVAEVSIDHDISHRVMMEDTAHGSVVSRPYPCSETFEPVAWFLREMAKNRCLPKITLHSANPAGAKTMAAILADCGTVEIEVSKPCNRLEIEGG